MLLAKDSGKVLGTHDAREGAVAQEAAIKARQANAPAVQQWAAKRARRRKFSGGEEG